MSSLVTVLRRRWCRFRGGHKWIVNSEYIKGVEFTDGSSQLRFAALSLAGCILTGLPDLALGVTGLTNVERYCPICGVYEKGWLFGQAAFAECCAKKLRGQNRST